MQIFGVWEKPSLIYERPMGEKSETVGRASSKVISHEHLQNYLRRYLFI